MNNVLLSAALTLTLTATLAGSGNHPPTTQPDKAATFLHLPIDIDVLANDSDADGDPLTVANWTQGAFGTVALNSEGTLTYTPKDYYVASDTFTYVASDGKDLSAPTEVTVTIFYPPEYPLVGAWAGR